MKEFCVLCVCGEMAVPFIASNEIYMSLIKEAYCTSCIDLKHPGINFLASGYLLDLNSYMDENTVINVDHKTSAMYSLDLGGFLGVRFYSSSEEAIKVCNFRTPFSANVEKVPLCLRNCREIKFGGMLEKDGSSHPEMACGVYNKAIRETITFKCDHYRSI